MRRMYLAQIILFSLGIAYGSYTMRQYPLALAGFLVLCAIVGLSGVGLGFLARWADNRQREKLYQRIGWDKDFRDRRGVEIGD